VGKDKAPSPVTDDKLAISERITAIAPAATGAVLVAIEEYEEKRWNVEGPLRDAIGFVEWLRSRDVPAKNIRVLASATPAQSEWAVKELGKLGVLGPASAKQSDIRRAFLELKEARFELLYVYWSGHGTMGRDNAHHLLTSDARTDDVTSVEIGQLQTLLKTTQVGATAEALRHQVFFFDVCSDYAESNKAVEQLAAKLTPAQFPAGGQPDGSRGQFVVRATAPGLKAANREDRGVFSRALLSFLNQQKDVVGWPEPMRCVEGAWKALIESRDAEHIRVPRFNGQDWFGSDLPKFGGEGFSPIRTDQLAELEHLLEGWRSPPPDSFLNAAWSLLNPALELPDKALTGRERWYWYCRKLSGSLRVEMLFEFLALCEECSRPGAAAIRALRKWMHATAEDLHLDDEVVKRTRRHARQRAKGLPRVWPVGDVLQFVLRPLDSLKGQERFQLHLGVYHQNAQGSELQAAGAREVSLEEVEEEFGEAIRNAPQSTFGGNELRLDFILPFGLFNLAVEQWKAPWGVSSRAMGTLYPTGRRFFERAYPDEAMRANPTWNLTATQKVQRQKWQAFSKRDFLPAHLCWSQDPSAFLNALSAAPADAIISVLAAATLESPAHRPATVFGEMLTSGVPVAVWLQQPEVDAEQVRSKLDGIFSPPIANWPANTRQFREKPPIACKNIALLWDNPLEPLPALPTYENAPLGRDI
jgi:hypothetical protein